MHCLGCGEGEEARRTLNLFRIIIHTIRNIFESELVCLSIH